MEFIDRFYAFEAALAISLFVMIVKFEYTKCLERKDEDGSLIHVRVARAPEDMLDSLHPKKRRYYEKQASKVANILNHKIIQSLLKEVIETEHISLDDIEDTRVMILPSIKDREYGDQLFGFYDHKEC